MIKYLDDFRTLVGINADAAAMIATRTTKLSIMVTGSRLYIL